MSLSEWMMHHVPVLQARWLFIGKWNGFATPLFICVKDSHNTEVVRHEQCHVRQMWEGWIVGFAVKYLWQLYVNGYQLNEYEIEARHYARIHDTL